MPRGHAQAARPQAEPAPLLVRVVVTSRPEADICLALGPLQPTVVRESNPRLATDLREFAASQLQEVVAAEDFGRCVSLVEERCGGQVLYIT